MVVKKIYPKNLLPFLCYKTLKHLKLNSFSDKMDKYFDHKSFEWSIQDFLNKCKIEPLKRKIDSYIKCLEKIANNGGGKRSKKAQVLINRYKKVNVLRLFC